MDRNERLYTSYEEYSLVKTQQEGEKELSDLVHTDHNEGHWFFVPDNNYWYNVPISEMVVNGAQALLEHLSKFSNCPKVVHYHTHLKMSERNEFNKFIEDIEKEEDLANAPNRFKVEESLHNRLVVKHSLPSEKCMGQLLAMNGPNIEYKIVTPMGVVIVEIQEGLQPRTILPMYGSMIDIVTIDYNYLDETPQQAFQQAMDEVNRVMDGRIKVSMQYKRDPKKTHLPPLMPYLIEHLGFSREDVLTRQDEEFNLTVRSIATGLPDVSNIVGKNRQEWSDKLRENGEFHKEDFLILNYTPDLRKIIFRHAIQLYRQNDLDLRILPSEDDPIVVGATDPNTNDRLLLGVDTDGHRSKDLRVSVILKYGKRPDNV